jgi:hypothetical protein
MAQIDPRPTDEALGVASRLHGQLVTVGRMHSLFDPAFASTHPDDTGRIPPFNPGQIKMLSVDHEKGAIVIPFFIRFIKRQATIKECAVCADELYDVDYQSVEEWIDCCQGFHGDWMWKVLLFPEKLGFECGHPIDFCVSCLQRHLEAQLQQYGRARCGQLACLSEGCGRRLSYEEIRLYASAETFST